MIYIAITLFALAAVGGIIMVIIKMSGNDTPLLLAVGHGVLAAAGLVLLILVSVQSPGNTLMNISLLLFVLTTAGGFLLFSYYIRKRPLPNALIAVHAFAAIVSYIALVIASRS